MKIRIPFTKRSFEIRSSLANPQQWLMSMLSGGGSRSKSGANVSAKVAMQVSAVHICVKVISETIASLPCNLYKRRENGKEKAENHDLYFTLKNLPNPETTAFDFWLMYIVNLLLTGDAFAYIKRDGNGKILELWNVPSKNVSIERNKTTAELYYKIRDSDGKEAVYYPESIMHTRGMRFDDMDASLDPIKHAREAIGLGMALEEYSSTYFGNGAQVGGLVKTPGKLSDTAFARFRDDFKQNYQGLANSNKILFLEEGSDFIRVSNNPEESQAIEAKKFQIYEICRFFNVPPQKVFELDRVLYNNAEHMNIEFEKSCINPTCVRIEQTIFKDLLLPAERKKYFAKFNTNSLLRADTAARKEFYTAGIQNGWFSPNDVRDMEDMNSYEGGNVYMVNGNVLPVSKLEQYFESKLKGGESNGQKGTELTAGTVDASGDSKN